MNTPLISRREFCRTAATVAAGLASLPPLNGCAAPPGKKLGFALAGLGNLSTHQLAPALQTTRYCRLAGIITGTPDKADRWQRQYGIPDRNVYNYATMDRLADNPEIDVVYVVTPNGLHAESAIKAARAGKHVLCEKPMEISVAQCEAMIAACRQAGRQLAVGYRLHFEPNNLECIRLARTQPWGPMKLIDARFGFRIGDPTQWRLKRALAGGGSLMDVGIYAVQAARYLSGEEPVSVSAVSAATDPVKFKEVEESVTWQFKFPRGVLAQGASTYGFYGMNSYKVQAEQGWWGLDSAFGYDGIQGMRSDGQAIAQPQVNQFAAEMDDFAQCILTGTPTRVPGEEGLRDVKLMMAIYEACRTGREQLLSA